MKAKESPWVWVPTLYLFEGLPYAIVNTIALAIFKDMGVDNGTLGPLTTLISLPWLVKPLWSPFMDIFRSKRWWILLTQFTMLATLAVIAFCLPLCSISVLMALFVVVAFASATHDIAADGYYMLALDQRRQSSFVGIRNTFYRGGLVLGQGLLVMLGGILQTRTGDIPKSWGYVLMNLCAKPTVSISSTMRRFNSLRLWNTRYISKGSPINLNTGMRGSRLE